MCMRSLGPELREFPLCFISQICIVSLTDSTASFSRLVFGSGLLSTSGKPRSQYVYINLTSAVLLSVFP